MFKKTIGSLIVASALTISLGAVNSEASQSSSAVVEQNQNHYGWSKLLQKQGISSNNTQIEFAGSNSTASGQSLFVNGYQIQSGKSDGQASASQSDDRTIVVVDEQKKPQLRNWATLQNKIQTLQVHPIFYKHKVKPIRFSISKHLLKVDHLFKTK